MTCSHAKTKETKGQSGLIVTECESCHARSMTPARMGPTPAYMSPEMLARLKAEHPDRYRELVEHPRKANMADRAGRMARLREQVKANGKQP